jgi:uncharacterized membrane protein YbaN (DUF454 family)
MALPAHRAFCLAALCMWRCAWRIQRWLFGDRKITMALLAVRLRTALSQTADIRALVLTLIAVCLRHGHRNEPADSYLLLGRPIYPAGRVPAL